MKFTEKIRFSNGTAIVFLQGKNQHGYIIFAYLRMAQENYKAFKESLENEAITDFKNYGEVLLQGVTKPSAVQIHYMEEKYRFSHSDITFLADE